MSAPPATGITPATAGFGPGSAYATWPGNQRAAADRMEQQYNHERRRQLAEHAGTTYVRIAPDASLGRLATVYRRQLEDIISGVVHGGPERTRLVRAMLTDLEREQDWRSALAASWLAADDGTHCYTTFMARGGLAAVLHHQATPPAYDLAALLDRLNWQRGLPHVLAWDGADRLGGDHGPGASTGLSQGAPPASRGRRR